MVLCQRATVLFRGGQARGRLLTGNVFPRARSTALCFRPAPSIACRTYATPGRPKTTVGETKRPIKKRTPKSTSTTATPKAKASKKKAPAKPKRKPVSEAAKKKKEAARKREDVKSYKEKALLDAPSVGHLNSFLAFVLNKAASKPDWNVKVDPKRAAEEWKALSEAETQRWKSEAERINRERAAAFARWLEQQTPDQIREANLARKHLRAIYKTSAKRPADIKDDRLVKAPSSSYILFANEVRSQNGNNSHTSVVEQTKDISAQWKALDAAQKQKYTDLAAQDRSRYQQEYLNVYGHPSPSTLAASPSP